MRYLCITVIVGDATFLFDSLFWIMFVYLFIVLKYLLLIRFKYSIIDIYVNMYLLIINVVFLIRCQLILAYDCLLFNYLNK